MYYDRRVCTKELAERVACVDAGQLQAVAKNILKNADVYYWLALENAYFTLGEC